MVFPGLMRSASDMIRHATIKKVEKQLLFCIPKNEKLLSYWDRVEDRLFKIRHCQNISGVKRQLALYEPPIDPALLVKAKAAGLNIEDIVGEDVGVSNYRFAYLIEKAKAFTSTVQGFGNALLNA